MSLPEGFVYLAVEIPDIILDIRYYSTYNFVGQRVDGYKKPLAIVSKEACDAFKKACALLKEQGYIPRIFDTYRPQKAVDHFLRWASDLDDTKNKATFYPSIDKDRIIPEGYVAEKSGHSRGSVIDLTLVDIITGKDLDMGSCFDFFGERSHHGTKLISKEQEANRNILKEAMLQAGFNLYDEEWWHYSLKDEPYPDTYFNFDVE